MNAKLKIGLLALLGFSTACCATKKASKKSHEGELTKIEQDTVEPHIMLMYGVPAPDGQVPSIMTEEEAKERLEQIRAEEERMKVEKMNNKDSISLEVRTMYGVPFPDGSTVSPLTEEEAKERLERIRAEEERMKREAEAAAKAEE